MKTFHLIYGFGLIAVIFAIWIVIAINQEHAPGSNSALLETNPQNGVISNEATSVDLPGFHELPPDAGTGITASPGNTNGKDTQIVAMHTTTDKSASGNSESSVDVDKTINDYLSAWRNKDIGQIDSIWRVISACEPCLQKLVDMIVKSSLEEGLMLELAIKMAALNTDVVLPAFDAIVDPAKNRSYAIIVSEKIINNGRPEFVSKIFELIYQAEQSGYDNFARQLTWVISKLENIEGILPILDTITGRVDTSPEYSSHVSSVFSKSIQRIPKSDEVASTLSQYYLNANTSEQEKLWNTVSSHEDTLVLLAVNADKNGQYNNVEKYARAIDKLPELEAVDGLVKLHSQIEYSSGSMLQILQNRVRFNPTIKVLHKLEDYMRDTSLKMDSRIFAAEGLLSVRENSQARYILEKVVNNTQYEDSELQAYIGGRL